MNFNMMGIRHYSYTLVTSEKRGAYDSGACGTSIEKASETIIGLIKKNTTSPKVKILRTPRHSMDPALKERESSYPDKRTLCQDLLDANFDVTNRELYE